MAQLRGTNRGDLIKGTRMDDSIRGLDGNDILDGRTGNDLLIGAQGADVLDGGAGDDLLRGGTRSQDTITSGATDTLDGGAGRDRLIGGVGRDLMTGGTAADKFVFQAADDSEFSLPDQITDFSQGEDHVVFRREFATANLHFIGQDPFSGVPGEVQYVLGDNATSLRIDLNGDGRADFRVEFDGIIHFQASDFSF